MGVIEATAIEVAGDGRYYVDRPIQQVQEALEATDGFVSFPRLGEDFGISSLYFYRMDSSEVESTVYIKAGRVTALHVVTREEHEPWSRRTAQSSLPATESGAGSTSPTTVPLSRRRRKMFRWFTSTD